MKKYFIVWVILLLSHAIYAQCILKGHLWDQDSLPLEGALVYIPEINKSTLTDYKGFYEFKNLPCGKVKVQISFISNNSKVESVSLTGKDYVLDVVLNATAIETEEIVVTGGYNSTQHENAVKIDVLKLKPAGIKITPNFAEVLTKVPGIDMISKGSGVSKPVIRGLSMNDILVLNNGVRFENYQYSSHHPLGIDEFGIEDIEIIKGPASLIYGSDAIGGVINFIKEKPSAQNSISGDYNLKIFSNSLGMTQNLGIKGSTTHFFAGIRAGYITNADYLQGGGDFVPNSREQEYSLKTNAGYTGKIGTLKLFYDFNRQNLGLVEDEPIEQITERGRKCNIFYQQLNTHLLSSQNKFYFGRMKLDINSALQNTELIHFGEPGIYEIQMNLSTLTYETKLYLPSDANSEYIVGFQGNNQLNKNLNNRDTKLLPDATMNNNSGFLLIQHTFFSKMKLQTGVRYDYKTLTTNQIGSEQDLETYRPALNKNYRSFSGSLGATYNLNETFLIRANIASAYRTPNLAELTSNGQHETRYEVGDANLDPEKSIETDLSLHLHQEHFTFDLAGFYNNIENYIFISPTGDTTTSGISIYKYKQGNSYLYGGEAGLHIHPSFAQWIHFETTFSSVTGKQKNGEYLPFIPAQKLNFEIRAEKAKIGFVHDAFISIQSNTAFDQNNAAPDETSTSGYTLIDFGLGGKIKGENQELIIGMGINNVFDKKYIDHLSTLKEVNMFNPGRNFTFSLKIPLGLSLKN